MAAGTHQCVPGTLEAARMPKPCFFEFWHKSCPQIVAHLLAKKPPWTVFCLCLININNF